LKTQVSVFLYHNFHKNGKSEGLDMEVTSHTRTHARTRMHARTHTHTNVFYGMGVGGGGWESDPINWSFNKWKESESQI